MMRGLKKSLHGVLCLTFSVAFFAYTESSFAGDLENFKTQTSVPVYQLPVGQMRVRQIGYRLAKANTDCAEPVFQTGLILHDIASFHKNDREMAKSAFRLTLGFQIVGLIEGSPGSVAGLRQFDEIVAINGRDMAAFNLRAITTKASHSRVEGFEELLQAELASGHVILTISRAGRQFHYEIKGEVGCGGRFTLLPTKKLNAWSDGKYVTISSAMERVATTDSELAFVVAHEMAHNILGHNARGKTRTELVSRVRGKEKSARVRELAADAMAIEIMRAAGYDPESSLVLFEKLKLAKVAAVTLSHPSLRTRAAMAKAQAYSPKLKSKSDTDSTFGVALGKIKADQFGSSDLGLSTLTKKYVYKENNIGAATVRLATSSV